jgi:hypothetical protein
LVVADCVTPSQLAPRQTSPNHSIRKSQLLVFAPLQGNPRNEMPSISAEPWDRARPLLLPLPRLKEVNVLKPYFVAVAVLFGWLSTGHGAEPRPKECDEAIALEGMRESRIETEFNRRGISDPVERITHRPEIEKQVDERIRIVKDICDRLLRGE